MPNNRRRKGKFSPRGFLGGVVALWLCSASWAAGQVVINEIMAANRTTTCTQDGEYEDWIELKNTGSQPINLEGYGLSDDPAAPFKWTFPARVLGPGEILVVWASGEDRRDGTDVPGLRREVYRDISGSAASVLDRFDNYPDFPDETGILTETFDAPRDVGDDYAQRISGFLEPPVTGNYQFGISSDNGGELFLSPDDDPAHARVIARIPDDAYSGYDDWGAFPSQRSAWIRLEAGRRYYMAATMKESYGGDHLRVRWQRQGGQPEIIPAAHFLARRAELHASFKISATGESIRLTKPDGTTADMIPAVALPADVSFGRPVSAPTTLRYFDQPSRGAENSAAGYAEVLSGVPSFSQGAGFYNEAMTLSLSTAEPGTTIIYTLDGSTPDPANLAGRTYTYRTSYPAGPALTAEVRMFPYTGPLSMTDRSAAPNHLSGRATTTWSGDGYLPTSPVFKGTVVRARLIKDGALPGPVVTNTYFVAPGAKERYQLPVISLSLNEDDLFDYARGIYTPGEEFDRWWTYSGWGDGGSPANYHRRGVVWERPVAFELFQPEQGRALAQNLGARVHGGWSRASPQKSLRLYADTDYDASDVINYPLIPGLTARGSGQPISQFRRILLRNAGNDAEGTRLRDPFLHELVAPLDVDRQGSQPAVHFINGEYWGLVSIRERIDGNFLAAHHGVDPDQVAILDTNAQVGEGTLVDRQDFLALRDFTAEHDLADPANYAFVAARMDLDNFIRYCVAEIYVNNRDWPTNNVNLWRVSNPDGAASDGAADGRWRWIVFDLDYGFGLFEGPETNTLWHATEGAGWYRAMLRALLANEEFRRNFLNTFADHMASSFQPSRVNALVDRMHAEIAPYLAEHRARWRALGDASVEPIKAFGAARPAHMRQHLLDYFDLQGTAPLTLDTPDPSQGRVMINHLVIDRDTPGLVDPSRPYPWTGEYFVGVPVTVTARPEEGYRFVGWLERPEETSATIAVNPGEETKLTALFAEAPPRRLLHYWNFNGSALLLPATTLIPGGNLAFLSGGTSAVVSDTGEGFVAENARNGDNAGAHLRVNNPLGATLEFSLPTDGYEAIVVSYETRRSGQGAGIQSVAYAIDGENFVPLSRLAVTETPAVQRLDMSNLPGVENNPNLRIRITFATGSGGSAGNNRFDNFVVEGRPMAGINHPPYVAMQPGDITLVEDAGEAVVDLGSWFEDVDEDELTWSFAVADGRFVTASVEGALLHLRGELRGGTTLTVTAHDGRGGEEHLEVRVMVHPSPHALPAGAYRFDEWQSSEPEFSYPLHALFVQSATNDPTAATPLDHPYAVGDDVAPGDSPGFPYNNASRTRINGLGADGVSFINTGRGRDVGGLLVALNTRGITEGTIRFTVETRVVNPRRYGMRLQVRVGAEGEFQDVLTSGGQPVVYLGSQTGPEEQTFVVPMPGVALDAPYVQFLWRYYHVSGTSGARTELRLDDVEISGVESTGYSLWGFRQFGAPLATVDPALTDPAADPFGLGLSNLMQYALGIHTAEDVAARAPRLESDSATGGVRFCFPFDPDKTDIRYIVETSGDLVTWEETIFDSAEEESTAPEDGWLSLDLDADAPARFYRLRVEAGPLYRGGKR